MVAVAMIEVGPVSFIATGPTRQDALDNLMDVWRTHADQTGSDPDWVHEEYVSVVEGPVGSVFRDGFPVAWNTTRSER